MTSSIFAIHYVASEENTDTSITPDNKNTIWESITMHLVCESLKCVNFDDGLAITTNGNLAPNLVIPNGGTIPLNGTKESTTNWYHFYLLNSESSFRNIPLKLEFSPFPRIWPLERYDLDLFIALKNNIPAQNFTESDYSTLDSPLTDKNEWSIVGQTTSTFESQESIKNYSPLYFPSASFTVIHHKIILSHSPDYIWHNIQFFLIAFLPIIPIFLIRFLIKRIPLKIATGLLFGFIAFITTIYFNNVWPSLPPFLTFTQVMMPIAIIASAVIVLRSLIDKKSQLMTTDETPVTISKEPSLDRKIKHTEDLVKNILQKLVDATPRIDRHKKLSWHIPYDYAKYRIQKIDLFSLNEEVLWVPITNLPKIDLDWSIQHLEGYPTIHKSWENTNSLIMKFNSKVDEIKKQIADKVIEHMKSDFPTFVEFQGLGTDNSFFSESISRILYYYAPYRRTKIEIPNFHLESVKFPNDEIHRIISDQTTVMQSPNLQNLDISKLDQTLNVICVELDLNQKFEELEKIRIEAIEEGRKFTKELSDVVTKLGKDIPIEGKCEWETTNEKQ